MEIQVGYESWDVNFSANHFTNEFAANDIVYLTSESPNELSEIDDTKVYIIGGLVDYNKLKRHCLGLAEDRGLTTAHLPLARYLDMRSRKVLTIDQVFRVILSVGGGVCWKDALLHALPPRKGAKGKEEEEEEEKDCSGDGEEGQNCTGNSIEKKEEKGGEKDDVNSDREKGGEKEEKER